MRNPQGRPLWTLALTLIALITGPLKLPMSSRSRHPDRNPVKRRSLHPPTKPRRTLSIRQHLTGDWEVATIYEREEQGGNNPELLHSRVFAKQSESRPHKIAERNPAVHAVAKDISDAGQQSRSEDVLEVEGRVRRS